MSLAATRILATRAITRKAPVQQQKRGIIDYLTNYPDKVLLVPLFASTLLLQRLMIDREKQYP
jgi:hypothetical protein